MFLNLIGSRYATLPRSIHFYLEPKYGMTSPRRLGFLSIFVSIAMSNSNRYPILQQKLLWLFMTVRWHVKGQLGGLNLGGGRKTRVHYGSNDVELAGAGGAGWWDRYRLVCGRDTPQPLRLYLPSNVDSKSSRLQLLLYWPELLQRSNDFQKYGPNLLHSLVLIVFSRGFHIRYCILLQR